MIRSEEIVRWLDGVIDSGIEFLRRNPGTQPAGLWRDFALPGVSAGSTEWVSAFIAAQIGDIPEGRTLAASAVQVLAACSRVTGGWGYREDVPEDCDSTAWVLLAASRAKVQLPASLVERSLRFILEHQRDDGGFVTFGPAAKEAIGTRERSGWFETEVSVTSAATLALVAIGYSSDDLVHRACLYLLDHQRNALWETYWWNGFAYPTYLAVLTLSLSGSLRDQEQCAAARSALLRLRNSTGGWPNLPGGHDNGFSTSFALRALLQVDKTPEVLGLIIESLQFLSGLVTEAGAFLPSTEMLAPGGVKGSNLVLRDNGLTTTACAVRAFHEVRSRLV